MSAARRKGKWESVAGAERFATAAAFAGPFLTSFSRAPGRCRKTAESTPAAFLVRSLMRPPTARLHQRLMGQCGSVAPGVQNFDNRWAPRLTIARLDFNRWRQPAALPRLCHAPPSGLQAFEQAPREFRFTRRPVALLSREAPGELRGGHPAVQHQHVARAADAEHPALVCAV